MPNVTPNDSSFKRPQSISAPISGVIFAKVRDIVLDIKSLGIALVIGPWDLGFLRPQKH